MSSSSSSAFGISMLFNLPARIVSDNVPRYQWRIEGGLRLAITLESCEKLHCCPKELHPFYAF